MTELASLELIQLKIGMLLHAEAEAAEAKAEADTVPAGQIPAYYGERHPYDAWLVMWRDRGPQPAAYDTFCQTGLIGWASRD